MSPWLLLRCDPAASEGGLREIETEPEGCGPVRPWDDRDNENSIAPPPAEVSPENGFVALAVGESKTFEVQWEQPGRLITEPGQYKLCHRGILIRWWKFGTLEELKGERKTDQNRKSEDYMWIACTNLVDFRVEEAEAQKKNVAIE